MIDIPQYKKLKAKGRTAIRRTAAGVTVSISRFGDDGDPLPASDVPVSLDWLKRLEDDTQKNLRNLRELIADIEATPITEG